MKEMFELANRYKNAVTAVFGYDEFELTMNGEGFTLTFEGDALQSSRELVISKKPGVDNIRMEFFLIMNRSYGNDQTKESVASYTISIDDKTIAQEVEAFQSICRDRVLMSFMEGE